MQFRDKRRNKGTWYSLALTRKYHNPLDNSSSTVGVSKVWTVIINVSVSTYHISIKRALFLSYASSTIPLAEYPPQRFYFIVVDSWNNHSSTYTLCSLYKCCRLYASALHTCLYYFVTCIKDAYSHA